MPVLVCTIPTAPREQFATTLNIRYLIVGGDDSVFQGGGQIYHALGPGEKFASNGRVLTVF